MIGDTPDLFDVLDQDPALKPELCQKADDQEPAVSKRTVAPGGTRKRKAHRSSAGASVDPSFECYLTEKDLTQRYKVSRQTLGRWVTAGSFPTPVMFGKKTKRWPLSVITDYDRQQAKASPRGMGKPTSLGGAL